MGLNIKNERTASLVRELAERTGTSQTSAVERAVAEALARVETGVSPAREERNARARAVLADLQGDDAGRAAVRDAQRDLYDDAGLPQ